MARNFQPNPRFLDRAAGKVAAAAERAAALGRDRARELVEDAGGHGIQHRGLPRRSSAPDEPPASQTGELAASIDSGLVSASREQAIGRFGSNAPHAALMELGGVPIRRYGARVGLLPRPYLRPALEERKGRMLAELRDVL